MSLGKFGVIYSYVEKNLRNTHTVNCILYFLNLLLYYL